MLFSGLSASILISRAITLLIAFTFHEFSHAFVADRFGDDTPRYNGRLTLNPLAHLDPIGSLLLLVVGFGWAKPVPVNAYALSRRSPSALMWVSLAGPFSNLVMALIAAIPFRLGLVSVFQAQIDESTLHFLPTLPQFLLEFIVINLVLMLFNLIPLAPLDGDKIAEYFFPPSWARVFNEIRPYSPIILMVLLFVLPLIGLDVIGWLIRGPLNLLLRVLLG